MAIIAKDITITDINTLISKSDTRMSVVPRSWDFDTDPFDPALGEWTVVTGTAPTVSGGVATPASSSEHIVLAKPSGLGDVEIIAKIATAGTLAGTGANWALIAKSTSDAQDFIMARYADVAGLGRLELYRRDSGSYASMAISGGGAYDIPLTVSTPYWLRFTVVGNVTTCDLWAAHPSNGGSPLRSVSYTLVSTGATKFGAGTTGRVGLRHSNTMLYPMDTLTVRPLFPPVGAFDEQVFTATGGWNAPDFAVAFPELAMTEITMIGPGGGSGGGAVADPGEACSGGGAGSQGAVTKLRLPTRVLGNGGTVTIGAPGTGGAPRTGRGNGNDGTSGTKSKFYPAAATIGAITAYAGNGGQGGRIGANALQGANTPQTTELPVVNAGAGINGAAGNTTNWHAGLLPSPSGGGGGIDAANNWKPGGNSGGMNIAEGSYAAASASEGADSQVPGDTWDIYLTDGVELSQGNSGANAGVAVDGGDAVTPGGYGGGAPGAGSTRTGNTSGAGADGAPSIVIIHTYLIGTR